MPLESLSDVRVLLVARKAAGTQILRTVFTLAGVNKITVTDEPRRAVELLCIEHFHAVFVEGRCNMTACLSPLRHAAFRPCSIP